MLGLFGIIASLVILGLSLVITQIATVALTLTGLSAEAAKFQAHSTFTGTGFTTVESEKVMNHPVRRRIIMGLMLLRSAGIVSILLSLLLSFSGAEDTDKLFRLFWLLSGIGLLWLLSRSRLANHLLKRVIEWALRRWTDLDTRDYVSLLKLSGPYEIQEIKVEEEGWLKDKKLSETLPRREGVIVLGIHCADGDYVGIPYGDTKVRAGDRLLLYGRTEALEQFGKRRRGAQGDQEHDQAVRQQEQNRREQDAKERERDRRDDATAAS